MDITITLSDERWQLVLDMLSEQSVKRALPIINEIVRQAKEQQQSANGLNTPIDQK